MILVMSIFFNKKYKKVPIKLDLAITEEWKKRG